MSDEVRSDELRFALDNAPYRWIDFVEYYGSEVAVRQWRSANKRVSVSGLRVLPQVGLRTFDDFVEHCRKSRAYWPVSRALQQWEAASTTFPLLPPLLQQSDAQCSDSHAGKDVGDAAQHAEQQSESTQSISLVHEGLEAALAQRHNPESSSAAIDVHEAAQQSSNDIISHASADEHQAASEQNAEANRRVPAQHVEQETVPAAPARPVPHSAELSIVRVRLTTETFTSMTPRPGAAAKRHGGKCRNADCTVSNMVCGRLISRRAMNFLGSTFSARFH